MDTARIQGITLMNEWRGDQAFKFEVAP